MSKSWLGASALCLVFVALFVVPAEAAGRPIELNYQFAGTIMDERNGMQGAFALTFSGRFQETNPQMEQETSGNNTYGPYMYNYSRTEYWGDNITQYKVEIVGFHYEYRAESYQQYIAKWYSGQACTGRLFIIWTDGSVSSYSVSLSPIEIARTVYQSSFYQESHDEERRAIYQWDPVLNDWLFLGVNETRFGSTVSGTINRKGVSIIFNGEIRGRDGRYNGLLIVTETIAEEEVTGTRYWDDFSESFGYTNTWREFMAMGKFGPYIMTTYSMA
jgi:hypothetical protein